MKALAAPLVAVLALMAAPLAAAAAPLASQHAVSELVAESAGAAPGSTLWVAVVQTLDKGWHTYWRNPGDAGEPTAITWTLPVGWQAGAIAWPTPERLPVGPIMNYGYEGKVVLPVPLQIPLNARVGDQAHLRAKVDYLVCAEVCVPGAVTLDLTVPVVGGTPAPDPAGGAVIAATLAALPKPSGLSATFQSLAPTIKLSVAGGALPGASAHDVYFYPYAENTIDHGKPEVVDRGPRGLTLTMSAGAAFAKGAIPASLTGVLAVDGKAYEVTASAGAPLAGAAGLGPPTSRTAPGLGLAVALGGAFLGGLILNLMPCVFPILSMKAAALARHAGEATRARGQALAFLGGVLVSFLALAGALEAARAAGAAVGWGFQLQAPAAVAVLSLIMLGAALNLSGLFEIGTSAQGVGAGLAGRGDLIGSAMTGVLAVVVAAPCTAPFMGPALGFALTQPPLVALTVFLALGLGFAAPFTLLSLSPSLIRLLPRPGAWMDVFRKALAFPMYAAAAWLVWVLAQQTGPEGLARMLAATVLAALGAWLFGMAQRRSLLGREPGGLALSAGAFLVLAGGVGLVTLGAYTPAPAAAAPNAVAPGRLAARAWSPQTLAALRAAHTPVFVNFTAAWCVTCQVNERIAFSAPSVQQAFARSGAVYLVADWTNRDAAIADALAKQGRIGVPLYLVYGADGAEPKVLPQLLTAEMVADAVGVAARHPS
jgi:thiol:disulfide interchange protein